MEAFADRQECVFCRDPKFEVPAGGQFRRDWEKHKAEHVVDKLEPFHLTDEMLGGWAEVTFEDTFDEIFGEAFALLVERQKKYGPENIRRLGMWGTFDRLASDKIERVRRAFNGTLEYGKLTIRITDEFDDETFEDALLDIANYAFIMLALKRGVWGRPLRSEVVDG